MKKRFVYYASLLSLMLLFTTIATTEAQIIGNKQVKDETRALAGNFHTIISNGSVDVILTQDPETKIVVRADANLIPLVTTQVKDDVLTIGVKRNSWFTAKTMKVFVSAPHIQKIQSQGSGDIDIKPTFVEAAMNISIRGSGDLTANLQTKNLVLQVRGSGDAQISGIQGELQLSLTGSGDIDARNLQLQSCAIKSAGSGDITLEGKTAQLTIVSAGSGDLDASDLVSVVVNATNAGSGDIKVHPIQKLQVSLAGSGNLTYLGKPDILKTKSAGSGEIRRR